MNRNTFFSQFPKFDQLNENSAINFYPSSECYLSRIKMGDVILMSDKYNLPFWTPWKITAQKILFVPCAIDKIAKGILNLNNDETNESLWNIYQYLYVNKPETGKMKVSYFGKTFEIQSERGQSEFILKNKHKILKNGERQEITVRMYMGQPQEMKIKCLNAMTIHQTHKYRIPQNLIQFSDITEL